MTGERWTRRHDPDSSQNWLRCRDLVLTLREDIGRLHAAGCALETNPAVSRSSRDALTGLHHELWQGTFSLQKVADDIAYRVLAPGADRHDRSADLADALADPRGPRAADHRCPEPAGSHYPGRANDLDLVVAYAHNEAANARVAATMLALQRSPSTVLVAPLRQLAFEGIEPFRRSALTMGVEGRRRARQVVSGLGRHAIHADSRLSSPALCDLLCALQLWSADLHRASSSLCLALDHPLTFRAPTRALALRLHDALDSVRWELTRPVGRLRDHLIDGGPPDVLLADLYAAIGEAWAVGVPDPPDPRVRACEHLPVADGRLSAYAPLVANDQVRQLTYDLATVGPSSLAVRATRSVGLFPEFRALVGGLADLATGCATAFGSAARFVEEWDDDAAA